MEQDLNTNCDFEKNDYFQIDFKGQKVTNNKNF